MSVVGVFGLLALVVAAYWWAVLPRLRKLAWWGGFTARVWAIAGNSKTIAIAYAVELMALTKPGCSIGRSWWAPKTLAGSW